MNAGKGTKSVETLFLQGVGEWKRACAEMSVCKLSL